MADSTNNASAVINRASVDSETRAAVQFAVIELCAEEDGESSSRMTPRAIAALAELACLYATHSLAADLEAFSTHAGRRTITDADVRLSARKIPEALRHRLDDFCEVENGNDGGGKRKAKKRALTVDLQSDKYKAPEADADSSSSDSDLMMDIDPPPARRRSILPHAKATTTDALLGDTDDDDVDVLGSLQSRLKKRIEATAKAKTDVLDSSDDDSLLKADSKPAAAVPSRRFRLNASPKASDTLLDDDSDDDDILQNPFNERGSSAKQKSSRVRQIMQTMDDDSVNSVLSKENDL